MCVRGVGYSVGVGHYIRVHFAARRVNRRDVRKAVPRLASSARPTGTGISAAELWGEVCQNPCSATFVTFAAVMDPRHRNCRGRFSARNLGRLRSGINGTGSLVIFMCGQWTG